MISVLDLCEAVASRTEEPEVAIKQYLEKFFPGQAKKSSYKFIGWTVPGVIKSIVQDSDLNHNGNDSIHLEFEEDVEEPTEHGGVWSYCSKERKFLILKSIRFFESLGYHAREGLRFGGKLSVGRWVTLDPIHTVPVTHKVRSEEKYLYHLTPSFNENSIKSQGFVPSNRNKLSSFHGNRLYFVLGTADEKSKGFAVDRLSRALKSSARDYAKELGRKKKDFDLYTVFTLSVSKIPKTVKFYEDPENDEYIYTYDSVPSNCIVNINQIDLKGKKGYCIF